jgi:hypothetical protein
VRGTSGSAQLETAGRQSEAPWSLYNWVCESLWSIGRRKGRKLESVE